MNQALASTFLRVSGAPVWKVALDSAEIGISPPDGVIPKGVTLNEGSIIIFLNAADSVVDVFQTVFHALFFRGRPYHSVAQRRLNCGSSPFRHESLHLV